MKNKKPGGEEAFISYYSNLYKERWEKIAQSFKSEPDYIELKEGLLASYFIDKASQFPVLALDIKPGMKILDMCAAPGGKTLLIMLKNGDNGTVVANDRSADRRTRLKTVLDASLPESLRKTVRITGYDSTQWGLHEKNEYDRILLDAPCSSERHVYLSKKHLDIWSRARIKQLASRQFAMIAAGFDALKSGGKLVYSTCSISPDENNSIIEKLLKKRAGMVNICKKERDFTIDSDITIEETEFGYQIMPDINNGAGPIFFAVVEKNI